MKKIDYRKTKNFWNSDGYNRSFYAGGYLMDAKFEKIARYRFEKEAMVLEKLVKFGGVYLDLGCGSGNFIFKWRKRFDKLIGIDFSKGLTLLAKKRCLKFKHIEIFDENILNFEQCLSSEIKLDFIFVGGCLMYINDNDVIKLIEKLYERTNPGGKIIFRESVSNDKIVQNEKQYSVIRRTVKQYKNLIENMGAGKFFCFRNRYYDYPNIIMLYSKILSVQDIILKILRIKIFEIIFLFLPLWIYSLFFNKKSYNYFFIIEKDAHER